MTKINTAIRLENKMIDRCYFNCKSMNQEFSFSISITRKSLWLISTDKVNIVNRSITPEHENLASKKTRTLYQITISFIKQPSCEQLQAYLSDLSIE